jgi:hypothetical protein
MKFPTVSLLFVALLAMFIAGTSAEFIRGQKLATSTDEEATVEATSADTSVVSDTEDYALIETNTDDDDDDAALIETNTDDDDAALIETNTDDDDDDAALIETNADDDDDYAALIETNTDDDDDYAALIETSADDDDAALIETNTDDDDAALIETSADDDIDDAALIEINIASGGVDKDQFIESGKDFCWRTSYGRGVGVSPSRCPDGYPDKCGTANARLQCCEACPKGYTRQKWPHRDTCKKKSPGKPVHQIVTRKTNSLCPVVKSDLSSGLCYKPCSKGFKSDGASMCWGKPPDLDYGWIKCGLGAARNAGTCVLQITEAVMGALETALFIASCGATSASAPATATAKGSLKGVKAWSQMSKLAKAKYVWKLTQDPVMAGKRLAKAMGRVEKVSDSVTLMSKAMDLFTGIKMVRTAAEGITQFVNVAKKVLKTIWDNIKVFFVKIWEKIKTFGKKIMENMKKIGNKILPAFPASAAEKISQFMTSLGDKASDFKKYMDDADKMAKNYGDEMFEFFGEDPDSFVNKNINEAREKLEKVKKNMEDQIDKNDAATEVNPLDFLPDEDVQEDISLNDQQPLKQFSQEEASQFAEGLAFLYPEKNESMALAFVYGDMNLLYAMYNTTSIAEESDREVYEESEISYPTDEILDETENSADLDDYFALTSEGTKYVSRMNNAWNDYKRWDSSLTDEDKNKCKYMYDMSSYQLPKLSLTNLF